MLTQQIRHSRDVGKMGHIGQNEGLIGEQAGSHQRQGRVLRPAYADSTVELLAAANSNLVHGSSAIASVTDRHQLYNPIAANECRSMLDPVQSLGTVMPTCFIYFPLRSAYEVSGARSPFKNKN